MSRIRTIKPEILEDEKTASLDHLSWRVFVSLISIADDYGNGRADHRWLAGQILWATDDGADDIREALARLSRDSREGSRDSLITLYWVGGQAYYAIRQWERHQKVDKPGKPRVPKPEHAETKGSKHVNSITYETSSRDSRGAPAKIRETLAPDPDPDPDQDREKDQEKTKKKQQQQIPPTVVDPPAPPAPAQAPQAAAAAFSATPLGEEGSELPAHVRALVETAPKGWPAPTSAELVLLASLGPVDADVWAEICDYATKRATGSPWAYVVPCVLDPARVKRIKAKRSPGKATGPPAPIADPRRERMTQLGELHGLGPPGASLDALISLYEPDAEAFATELAEYTAGGGGTWKGFIARERTRQRDEMELTCRRLKVPIPMAFEEMEESHA